MDLKVFVAKYNGIESKFFLFLIHICIGIKWMLFYASAANRLTRNECRCVMRAKITFKLIIQFLLLSVIASNAYAQTSVTSSINRQEQLIKANRVIEIRSYTLKQGTRDEFHHLFLEQALPLLKKWNVEVVTHGPSLHDSVSYFLVRSYKDLH